MQNVDKDKEGILAFSKPYADYADYAVNRGRVWSRKFLGHMVGVDCASF